MSILTVYEAIVGIGAKAEYFAEVARMRLLFVQRTGSFGPEDSYFETRSRAFWDDAITFQGFASTGARELPEELRKAASAFPLAHRGLFSVASSPSFFLLRDTWRGASFLVEAPYDGGLRDALAATSGLFDGRLVADTARNRIVLLPGVIFHPPDATDLIHSLLTIARDRHLGTQATLDALLRMELAFCSLSRVKAKHTYRPELFEG